jgi:hypothetical protein
MCNFLVYLVVPQWCDFWCEKIIFLFAGCFQDHLLDAVLDHPSKGERQIKFEACVSHIGDCEYGGLRQARVVVV